MRIPNLDASIFSLKAIKSIIPVGPLSLPTINLLNAFHSLLIFIGKPLVCTIPSYVKDTTDFLTNSPPLTFFLIMPCLSRLMSRHCILTSHIMKELMLVVFFLQKRTNKHIPTETICDLIRIIFTMSNFAFNSKHYLQKHGTAMGTRMAPS